MIFDRTLQFCDNQSVFADAPSSDVIDLKVARDIGKGGPIPLVVQVTEDFNNLTSLALMIQCAPTAAFSSPRTIVTYIRPLASLWRGAQFSLTALTPGVNERFLRLYFDVTGTAPTSGRITAGVLAGPPQSSGITY